MNTYLSRMRLKWQNGNHTLVDILVIIAIVGMLGATILASLGGHSDRCDKDQTLPGCSQSK